MAKQEIDRGTTANDGTGDPDRTAWGKVNDNFTELYPHIVEIATGADPVVINLDDYPLQTKVIFKITTGGTKGNEIITLSDDTDADPRDHTGQEFIFYVAVATSGGDQPILQGSGGPTDIIVTGSLGETLISGTQIPVPTAGNHSVRVLWEGEGWQYIAATSVDLEVSGTGQRERLPPYTSADNGKVLTVVAGVATWV